MRCLESQKLTHYPKVGVLKFVYTGQRLTAYLLKLFEFRVRVMEIFNSHKIFIFISWTSTYIFREKQKGGSGIALNIKKNNIAPFQL